MKKLLILPLILVLSGCVHKAVPITPKFPTAPELLLEKCPSLNTLPDDAKLSDLMRTDIKNMVQYHECSHKNKAWVEWYTEQKAIFEAASKK